MKEMIVINMILISVENIVNDIDDILTKEFKIGRNF